MVSRRNRAVLPQRKRGHVGTGSMKEFIQQDCSELGANRHLANYDVSADGESFIMLESDEAMPTEINVVLNWFEELKHLVPTGK